ncbi:MAG TPA: endonuclease V, partial [candidate division Zixibacteria bacterium]|nr:endonuclease V [candidate division Zixibacteria bacterium]
FVSPGNLISVDAAAEIALACATKYRIPEPTRLADKIVGEFKKNYIASGGERNMLDL